MGHRTHSLVVAERGQAMVEYAAILGFIAAALVLIFSTVGGTTAHLLDQVVSQL